MLSMINTATENNLPHTVVESPSSFSIVMNLLGVRRKDVALRVNSGKREVAILARKETRTKLSGFYWVFGVPAAASLEAITTRYRRGVLEIRIPKGRVAQRAQLALAA